MPRRNSLTRRLLRHLLLVSLVSGVLSVLGRRRPWDEWDGAGSLEDEPRPEAQPAASGRGFTRRFAVAFSFCLLFFAGLAFSAGAGDGVRGLLEADDTTAVASETDTTGQTDTTGGQTDTTGTTETERTAVEQSPQEGVPTPQRGDVVDEHQPGGTPVEAAPAPRTAEPSSSPPRPVLTTRAAPAAPPNTAAGSTSRAARPTLRRSRPQEPQTHRQKKPVAPPPLDPEVKGAAAATVWLNRAAPDPTPAAARLRLGFARELVAYSAQAHVDWALVLAVLRAGGHEGRVPATRASLRTLSFRLGALGARANPWASALAYSSDASFADRVVALRHYYRAVGLAGLVYGLVSQKADLQDRVLHDSRLQIYPGGRNDVAAGRVDVRVLALLLYLAETYHQVTVSCLVSGHRLYARPGVISAHIYGRAVDIAALGGMSIYGHQRPGGITEQAVRSILMLPGGMLPAQVISLLGLGGPSFPLANHYHHIHVGY
jgi:hypothetical protein